MGPTAVGTSHSVRSQRRILLAGVTGYIGRAVAQELVRRGDDVIAPVRRAGTAPADCAERVAEATDANELRLALGDTPVDAVISCIASRTGVNQDAWQVDFQANTNLLRAARDSGAGHFVLLSAICVQKPRLAFQYAKLAFEAELARSGIRYSIVRPTAYFKSLSGQVERVRRGKPFLLFGAGTETACKPIGRRDLAVYLVDCLDRPDRVNRILPVGGPGRAVTPRDQGQLLFELTGKSPRFRSVPVGLFTAASSLLDPIGTLLPRAAAKAELARIGHYYATESMLVWDEERQRYSAAATPETGSVTLREHYASVLQHGLEGHELGEQRLF
jgi:divinyl chlorophyllide a 8-vinyl-reductase